MSDRSVTLTPLPDTRRRMDEVTAALIRKVAEAGDAIYTEGLRAEPLTISALPPAEQFAAITAHHRRLDAGRLTLMLALQQLDQHLRAAGKDGVA